VARQREYGDRQRLSLAVSHIDGLIRRRKLAYIEIATDWPGAADLVTPNSAAALSSVMARVDVLLTNRLHGLVFALRNGVPALAVDGIAGGDKLSAQARVLNWPVCLLADEATPEALDAAFAWCRSAEARAKAREVSAVAAAAAAEVETSVATMLALSAKSGVVPPASAAPSWTGRFVSRLFGR
jgi:hypothetical protein